MQLINQSFASIELKCPNAETRAAFEEAQKLDNLVTYHSVQEVFDEIWE